MIEKLTAMYPNLNFVKGETYSWNPETNTITYSKNVTTEPAHHSLLHELAHYLLEHKNYKHDVGLLKMERDAWALAKKMLLDFGLSINLDHIEDCLDTYRDWIYSRSKCPQCSHVGFQSAKNSYSCVFCVATWRVPESRLCMVKRTLDASVMRTST